MVEGAQGPWHNLHQCQGPQTPRLSHQVLFRPSHHQHDGYPTSNEDPLQQRWRHSAIHKRNGSSAAQIQACKTLHPWRVYARCGTKNAASIRWVRGRHGSGRNSWKTSKPGQNGKLTFRAAYIANRQEEAAREGEEKPFGGSPLFGLAPGKTNDRLRRQEHKKTEGNPQLTNQMLDSLEGYLDNITAAATQTDANGGPMAELAAVWQRYQLISPD